MSYTFVYSASPPADVRWTGDADITNDPKLESLTENYLKIRKGRLRNIAFNANVTGGDEIKQMTNEFLQFCHKYFCRTIFKL